MEDKEESAAQPATQVSLRIALITALGDKKKCDRYSRQEAMLDLVSLAAANSTSHPRSIRRYVHTSTRGNSAARCLSCRNAGNGRERRPVHSSECCRRWGLPEDTSTTNTQSSGLPEYRKLKLQ